MDDMIDSLKKKEFISVCIRDPHTHKADFWHTHVDYEICLHTNSMCFRKKTSCVRRRYSEFVWLRQRLQDNAVLITLPKLPPWNPFFSWSNSCQVAERMKGLQKFLEDVMQIPLLLSSSRLHLFLQSQLNIMKIEACIQGNKRYTVAQAIQGFACDLSPSPFEEDESKISFDSDCDSTTSSGFGHSMEPAVSLNEGTSVSGDHCYDA
ncbi:sorting nexin-10A [Clupea harengus]|uniref:Sorting nexin-10A n=1 Tax=Clupea harengus TaxID=7950 RepID=A0A6P3W783_CLUHA|nr:sorting nexin-10A [Clupea harengus]